MALWLMITLMLGFVLFGIMMVALNLISLFRYCWARFVPKKEPNSYTLNYLLRDILQINRFVKKEKGRRGSYEALP